MGDNPLFDGQGLEFHHLQRHQQQQEAAAIRRLLEEEARRRKGVCPCPHCGGGIPTVGVSVCMHCRRELHWANDFCAATKEQAQQRSKVAAARAIEQKRAIEAEERRQAEAAAYCATPEGQEKLEKRRKRRAERQC
jgi:hypothetical protein